VSEAEAPVVGVVKAYNLFDTMLKGFGGHLAVIVIFPHKGEGALKLEGFLTRRSTPNHREEGV
jgi:hypothetical protein